MRVVPATKQDLVRHGNVEKLPLLPAALGEPGSPQLPDWLGDMMHIEEQAIMDLSVRLKYGDVAALHTACKDFCALLSDMPAAVLVCHGPLIDGLCRALAANDLGPQSPCLDVRS